METNQVINADCIEWLRERAERGEVFADLIFADPPFNIGYQYDVYEDVKAYDDYHAWTADWMRACRDVLKPAGAFWVAIGAEYAAEVRMIGRELGLTLRNWVIWHYTFGQNTKAKFARAHVHMFYFVKDPVEFTFRDKAVRTFSDRQRQYKDKRANPLGKIPDDVWQEFPRVCGTFGERLGWHPCQMPISILTRIIRSCSEVGDVVFDPFSGSGTTLAAAKRVSRRYMGTELSENYIANIRKRLDDIVPVAESQPAAAGDWPAEHVVELQWAYMDCCVSTTLLYENPHLLEAFAMQFNNRLAESGDDRTYEVAQVWGELERLRCGVKLGMIKVHASEPKTGKPRPCPRAKLTAAKRKAKPTSASAPAGGLFARGRGAGNVWARRLR